MAFGLSAGAAALIGGGLAVGGALISADASRSAANTQADAAAQAGQQAYAQYLQTREDLSPYRDAGKNALDQINGAMANPLLSTAFKPPTAAEAAATPGYQFTLDQGLKAAQNSASARGLGASGAALKGASTFATGLADSTYNDVYNRSLGAFKTNYGMASDNVNRLLGVATLGQNAAANTGTAGVQTSNTVANTLTGAGNALAAGTVGGANAISGGLNSAGNSLLLSQLMNRPSSTMYGGWGNTLPGLGFGD